MRLVAQHLMQYIKGLLSGTVSGIDLLDSRGFYLLCQSEDFPFR